MTGLTVTVADILAWVSITVLAFCVDDSLNHQLILLGNFFLMLFFCFSTECVSSICKSFTMCHIHVLHGIFHSFLPDFLYAEDQTSVLLSNFLVFKSFGHLSFGLVERCLSFVTFHTEVLTELRLHPNDGLNHFDVSLFAFVMKHVARFFAGKYQGHKRG